MKTFDKESKTFQKTESFAGLEYTKNTQLSMRFCWHISRESVQNFHSSDDENQYVLIRVVFF